MKKLTDTTKDKKDGKQQKVVFYINKQYIINRINKA